MTDIVERLRRWAISTDAVPASDLMDEAAAEIERLRSQPCPYVAGAVTKHCTLTPLALTDAERAAVEIACQDLRHKEEVATMRGLLERLSPPAT